MAAKPPGGDALGRALGDPNAADPRYARTRAYSVGYRRLLLSARGGEFWRRLRGPCLYGAGGGKRLRLAAARRDGRWPRARRNDAGAAHSGDAVRRISCRMARRCALHAPRRSIAGQRADFMGHLRALFLVDILVCTLD